MAESIGLLEEASGSIQELYGHCRADPLFAAFQSIYF